MRKWFYSLYKIGWSVDYDDKHMDAIITPNKPARYQTDEERNMLTNFVADKENKGYFVVVRD